MLTDVCGTVKRANFWTALSNVTLILVPVIFAMHYHPKIGQDTSTVFKMGPRIEWALIGLVVSVVILGIVLAHSFPASRSNKREDSYRAHIR